MTDKRQPTLVEQLQTTKAERDAARADLSDLRKAMWAVLKVEGIGPEELATGLALLASIASRWPHSYTPDHAQLASLAKVPESIVVASLDALAEAGVIHASD